MGMFKVASLILDEAFLRLDEKNNAESYYERLCT